MSHYAQLNDNNIVVQVIVAEQEFIDSGAVGDPTRWLQTSWNTHGGVHRNGGTPLRKNYAGMGYSYDPQRDAFIPPQPFPSWLLNDETCLWEAPTAMPTDGGAYMWNEADGVWTAVERQV